MVPLGAESEIEGTRTEQDKTLEPPRLQLWQPLDTCVPAPPPSDTRTRPRMSHSHVGKGIPSFRTWVLRDSEGHRRDFQQVEAGLLNRGCGIPVAHRSMRTPRCRLAPA